MKLKDSELKALLAEVEQEMTGLLKAEADKLAKAAGDDDEDEAHEGSADDAQSPGPASGPPEGSPASPPPESSASAPPAEGSAPPPDEQAPAADPAQDDQPMDMDALKAEYSKLPPNELKLHYMAAKAALFASMGGGAEASAAGDAGQPAPPPPAAPAMKAELKASPGNGGKMAKSETEEKQGQEIALLKNQMDVLVNAFDKVLAQPLRKAVTSVAAIPRVEEQAKSLSKSEIDRKLSDKARTNLKKSDRELINKFYTGGAGMAEIEHLLK